MNVPYRDFSEIVRSRDANAIAKNMANSHLNQSYKQLQMFMERYAEKDYLELSDFYGLAHCIYGWMPRMLVIEEKMNLKTLNIEWKSAEKGIAANPNDEFFPETLKLCGNSIVGLSKLLHFAHPEKFAIIDSNVYKALKGKDTTMPHGLKKRIPLYRKYIKWISEINDNSKDMKIIRKKDKSLAKLSKNRVIELYLYTIGKTL